MILAPPPRGLVRAAKALIVVAGLLIVVNFSLVIFRPTPVQAFPGEAMAAAIYREVRQIFRDIRGELRDKLNKALKVSADVAFKNAIRVFVGQLAEDTATWIASAGTGQKPLFITNKNYFKDLGNAAAGDFIDTVAKNVLGKSLCQPVNIQARLRIVEAVEGLTFLDPIASCRKRCNLESQDRQGRFQNIQENLQQAVAVGGTTPMQCNIRPPVGGPAGPPTLESYEFGAPGVLLPANDCATALRAILSKEQARDATQKRQCLRQCQTGKRVAACSASDIANNVSNAKASAQVSLYFEAGENDIGQLTKLNDLARSAAQQAIEGENVVIDSKFIPPRSKVSGEALAPASGVELKLGEAINQSTKAETTYTGSIAADTLRIFTNTLTKRLTERLFKSKCGLNPAACRGPGQATSPAGSLLVSNLTGVAAARLQFSSIGQIDYVAGEAGQTEDVFQTMRNRGLKVDERLVQAVTEKKTVQEALDAGLVDSTKTFGFDKQGAEPSDGYPYRLILYLRHYRVVPVGWELAAQYIGQFDRRDIGLKELSQLYDQRTVKNPAGDDVPNPYYRLIDPNWVLKSPATFCKRRGAGEEIVSRRFVCDEDNDALQAEGLPNESKPNCALGGSDVGRWQLARNTDYCTDEQTCIAENDDGSCKQFGYCFAEKRIWRFDGTSCPNYFASCTAYTSSEGQDVAYLANTTDTRNCSADVAGCRWYCADPAGPGTDGNWSCTVASTANRLYLDRDAQECPSGAAGCTRFLRTIGGANLLANGGFERFAGLLDDPVDDDFPSWTTPGNHRAVTSDLPLTGASTGTALALNGAAESAYESARSLVGRRFTFSLAGRASGGGRCTGSVAITAGQDPAVTQAVTFTPQWGTFSVSAGPVTADAAAHLMTVHVDSSCEVFVDAAKLEEAGSASAYADYGASAVHLNSRRSSCQADEVGCERYTPVRGGQATDGVVTDDNRCPASAVGCQAFRQLAIDRIPQRPAVDPVTIIASTAKQCSAAAVGCEEYTNLDAQARGGEAREYYSQLKQCVRPGGPNQATFFSWVGSESRGYELKSYRLLRSDVGTGPCTSLNVVSTSQEPSCNDGAVGAAICAHTDLATNPDCTEFFDEGGNVFYRLRSRTILVSDRCYPARNSVDVAAGSDLLYMVSPDESVRCSSTEANCREFKGSTGNAVRQIFRSTFEEADNPTAGWEVPVGSGVSTESLVAGGHSLRLVTGTSAYRGALPVQLARDRTYLISFIARGASGNRRVNGLAFDNGSDQRAFLAAPLQLTGDWKLYRLGPVVLDHTLNPTSERLLVQADGEIFLDDVQLTEVRDSLYLIDGSAASCTTSEVNCELYRDRAGQRHALTSFNRLCSPEKVGCEELINSFNSTSPYAETVKGVTTPADQQQFVVVSSNAACRSEEAGCSALGLPTIATVKNSAGVSLDTVASWQTAYRRVDPDRFEQILCEAGQDQCREYAAKVDGNKQYFRDPEPHTCAYQRRPGTNEYSWFLTGTTDPCPSTTLVDQCEVRSVDGLDRFCYRSSAPGTCEFPCVTRLCEGSQTGCTEYRDPADPPNCRVDCSLELVQGQPRTVDEFCRDRAAGDGGLPGCTSYTFLRQTIEDDVAECSSQVNQAAGCRPFLDTSNPARTFRGG